MKIRQDDLFTWPLGLPGALTPSWHRPGRHMWLPPRRARPTGGAGGPMTLTQPVEARPGPWDHAKKK
jgi:hypothetical protein